MMKKWTKIKDHVEEANSHEDADIAMPPASNRFAKAAKNVKLCFDDIHATTTSLQERMLTLSKCRDLQEELIAEATDNRNDESSCWYKNSFGDIYIPFTSEKRPNKDFVNAVCKVQARKKHELTRNEMKSVEKWFKRKDSEKDGIPDCKMSLAERKKAERTSKRKADGISRSKAYEDDSCLDHVIGSAAEVERLWSVARYLLTTQRATMTPIVFEAVLFLKFNHSLWDEKTVQQAYSIVVREKKEKRLADKLKIADNQDDDIACTMEEVESEEEDMQLLGDPR